MNGLPLCSLTPDADALLMMPRSTSYCELGFTAQQILHTVDIIIRMNSTIQQDGPLPCALIQHG